MSEQKGIAVVIQDKKLVTEDNGRPINQNGNYGEENGLAFTHEQLAERDREIAEAWFKMGIDNGHGDKDFEYYWQKQREG